MSELEITYNLDDRPPVFETLIYGLQWLAITMATVIIIGKVVAGLHFDDPARLVVYISYLSGTVKAAFSPLLTPVLGNGFVMGVLTVLILEHLVYRARLPAQPG